MANCLLYHLTVLGIALGVFIALVFLEQDVLFPWLNKPTPDAVRWMGETAVAILATVVLTLPIWGTATAYATAAWYFWPAQVDMWEDNSDYSTGLTAAYMRGAAQSAEREYYAGFRDSKKPIATGKENSE